MNVVLVGYRGTGKSRVGKAVAAELGLRYVEMDSDIVGRAGMPIPEIVRLSGWPRFRDLESAVARELSREDGLVIDTGGGVVERPENVEELRRNACVVWLKASAETIVARIRHSANRPALTDGKTFIEEVAEVLERRTPLYRGAAHLEIDTDALTPDAVTERIALAFRDFSESLE
jgi:shikimate kinase